MELATERLRLRCLAPADAEALMTYLNDWEVTRWLARPPYSYVPADAAAFTQLMRERHEGAHPLLFAIAERADNRLCGVIGIDPVVEAGGGELGYWLGRPFWGRRYGSEAATALIADAAAAGLTHLTAYADPLNARSIRLLEACGFRGEGEEIRDGRNGPAPMRSFLLRPLTPDGNRRSSAAPA
jgi:RimJ/RimL family protein N-acetyltransferase